MEVVHFCCITLVSIEWLVDSNFMLELVYSFDIKLHFKCLHVSHVNKMFAYKL